jgi:membrane-bound lytic murein transglycosylase D
MMTRQLFSVGTVLTLALLGTGCSLHDVRKAGSTGGDYSGPGHHTGDLGYGYSSRDRLQNPLARDARRALREPRVPPEEAPDIWTRARHGFQFTEHLEHARVSPYIAHYAGNPNIIRVSSARATPFAHFIVTEIERRGIPSEILLLPIVESGFAPEATSVGRAAGIWQFIPSTGAYYGLIQDPWFDGRRDVYLSTLVALDYLERLYARFGDWYLALAAYNTGQGNVARAIEANAAAGRPTDYWSLQLAPEAMSYVPRLLALRAIIEDPKRFGKTLPHIENKPVLRFVDLGRQADLEYVAELSGLSIAEIRRMNPGYRRAVTHPDAAHHLLLPHSAADRLEAALARRGADHPLIRHREYIVRAGDTLSQIAARTGSSITELRRTNQLQGDLIRVGQTLRIPSPGGSGEEPVTATMASSTSRNIEYTVRQGDNLWAIARRHDMRVADITAVNGITADAALQPGQVLRIPTSGTNVASAEPTPSNRRIDYEIRSGDSLEAISRRFRVAVNDLRRWNGLNGDAIRAGDTLTVYLASGS